MFATPDSRRRPRIRTASLKEETKEENRRTPKRPCVDVKLISSPLPFPASSVPRDNDAKSWGFVRRELERPKCWVETSVRLPPDMRVGPALFDELWALHPDRKG